MSVKVDNYLKDVIAYGYVLYPAIFIIVKLLLTSFLSQ